MIKMSVLSHSFVLDALRKKISFSASAEAYEDDKNIVGTISLNMPNQTFSFFLLVVSNVSKSCSGFFFNKAVIHNR